MAHDSGYVQWLLPGNAANAKFTVSSYDVDDGCEKIVSNGVTVVDNSGNCAGGNLCQYSHSGSPGTVVDVIGPAVTMDVSWVDSFPCTCGVGHLNVQGTVDYYAPVCADPTSQTITG